MADKDQKPPFNLVRVISVFTIVIALLLFILSLFNQHEVMWSVFGYRHKEISLFLVILWSFLAGMVYVFVVWAICAIKSGIKIKAMKKTIQDLSDKLEQSESENAFVKKRLDN